MLAVGRVAGRIDVTDDPPRRPAATALRDWQTVDEEDAGSEFRAPLLGWSTARRFVVVRARVRADKEAVGRRLVEVPGDTFRLWVTNRTDGPLELWRADNGRATVAQRIAELKNDRAADDFCTPDFWATAAAFVAVLFAVNLLRLYQRAATPATGYRQPAPLRAAVFVCGAILGRSGHTRVRHLSATAMPVQAYPGQFWTTTGLRHLSALLEAQTNNHGDELWQPN